MEVSENIHDKVAKLCLAQFKKLPKSGKPKLNEWTILSCIVLEYDDEISVVALGTGSKCIGKNKLSVSGDILNDSHAEIICRRSFLKYLYFLMRKDNNLLNFNVNTKKYRLNQNARFHFFTTHVPCGDAAIFSKQNPDYFGSMIIDDDNIPSKKLRIDFRTGAKCLTDSNQQDLKLPGINYHTVGVVRTKPGRGDPTLSVSCSDKLAKWCCLGIQGALLSLLLEEPIYLTSFTIDGNTSFCEESFNRAIYSRLATPELTPPYFQKQLLVGQSTIDYDFSKSDSKQPCPCSISWCNIEGNNIEVLVQGKRQGVTKKNYNSVTARSKISKYELFKNFTEVCTLKEIIIHEHFTKNWSYKKTKMLAVDYQNSWLILKKSFKIWAQKNDNLLAFVLDPKDV